VKPGIPKTVPDALPLRQALDDCEPLRRLHERLAAASMRMDAIRPLLPQALLKGLKAGPTDDSHWTLLAANAAVAAKLRQFVPRLEAVLRQRGLEPSTIRVRIQSSHMG
jgi:hypothetical protein